MHYTHFKIATRPARDWWLRLAQPDGPPQRFRYPWQFSTWSQRELGRISSPCIASVESCSDTLRSAIVAIIVNSNASTRCLLACETY